MKKDGRNLKEGQTGTIHLWNPLSSLCQNLLLVALLIQALIQDLLRLRLQFLQRMTMSDDFKDQMDTKALIYHKQNRSRPPGLEIQMTVP